MACNWQFGSRRRDYLYSVARTNAYLAGRGDHPICPHCDEAVLEHQRWHECHVGAPKCFGGKSIAVGHAACNRRDGREVVTPAAAKAKRVRQKLVLGVKGPGLGRHPLPGGRLSTRSKTVRGRVVARVPLAEAHAAFMAKRYPFLPAAPERQRGEQGEEQP